MNFNESLEPDARLKSIDNLHVRIRSCLIPNQTQVLLEPDQKPIWTEYIHTCLKSGSFCDVFFQCDDALIGAHRIVISSSSSYLKTLFQESNQDQVTIILPGVSGQMMHLYLRLLYGEKITVHRLALFSLLRDFGSIAVSLGITDLRLSKSETKGHAVKDLGLKQKLMREFSASMMGCDSCNSLNTITPDIGNNASQEKKTRTKGIKRRALNTEVEDIKAAKINGQVRFFCRDGFSTSTPKTAVRKAAAEFNNTFITPIPLSGVEKNKLWMSKRAIFSKTRTNKKLKSTKLKSVLKRTVLSDQRKKEISVNMKKTTVKVLIKRNENFNNDSLQEAQRLKDVLTTTTKSLVSSHSKISAQKKPDDQTKKRINPNYARPPEWRPKVRFNCKTWNLPPTLLIREGADKKKGFTCAICQRRLYGREKANFHVYQNHYPQLCSLAGDAVPQEIKPDFSQPMWGVEYLEKEKLSTASNEEKAKEKKLPTNSHENKTEETQTSKTGQTEPSECLPLSPAPNI